jgi:uncharacterized protein YdhG (YjbR/CyaY superfamily)
MTAPASVEAYLAGLSGDSRVALETLRETIKAAAPEATDAISYGMPAFKDHGRVLVYYAAFKHHYSLFPASKGVIEALREELQPYEAGKGTIRFRMEQPVATALVTKIVKARLEENAARGDR